ncbi:hypothetical protein [Levilactobacillus angrenensis]|uniref:Uncharacterized protein n=1 Tax=Levilactobacillus angrenensis TaxID=2486020 RepID=A0ABW1UBC1_9LACO|nr:hypothetical protein [Levilactobacillus angrenensis]
MKILTRMFAGQSLISWGLQLILIYLAWQVSSQRLPNNLWTISGVAVLLVLIYVSLANDGKQKNRKRGAK